MVRERLKKIFPSWQNALLALLAAGLLILAFPDFELWWVAWFALVPLMWAVERERSAGRSFLLGWLFGTAFFFGTCWWLTYAPIHYAAMPWPLAYLLIFIVCLVSGISPGIFSAILARLLRRFNSWAFLAAPFVWVFTEFLRYWLTGNNWNAIGYSQAFAVHNSVVEMASVGGVLFCGFALVLVQAVFFLLVRGVPERYRYMAVTCAIVVLVFLWVLSYRGQPEPTTIPGPRSVIALQPNVPANGLNQIKWQELRDAQFSSARAELEKPSTVISQWPMVIVLPESPMNFAYEDDPAFRKYIGDFSVRNNVSVLFNSSQPDKTNGRYFNSAVMVGPDGKLTAQYDKVYLLPFGEAVPPPLENIVPAFVGHFSYGSKYDLMPIGEAKAGVMICFESHFGELGRRYVQNGADAIIEMTNDGYLGLTPVLRQHLANAVFRAVETNRPVLRVTNVGITAYIDERGNVLDPLPSYTEGTRVWTVSKSDGSQTFYVRYGDWFAWLCVGITVILVALTLRKSRA